MAERSLHLTMSYQRQTIPGFPSGRGETGHFLGQPLCPTLVYKARLAFQAVALLVIMLSSPWFSWQTSRGICINNSVSLIAFVSRSRPGGRCRGSCLASAAPKHSHPRHCSQGTTWFAVSIPSRRGESPPLPLGLKQSWSSPLTWRSVPSSLIPPANAVCGRWGK